MLSEAIKMAVQLNEGIKIVMGTVEEIDLERSKRKLVIRISQKIEIDNNSMVIDSRLTDELAVGDTVVMLAEKDFQRFYLLFKAEVIYDDDDIMKN